MPVKGVKDVPAFSGEGMDIVDEAIHMFRAIIMFRNYKPQGGADKLIVFLTIFIQKCLEDIGRKPELANAETAVGNLVKDAVPTSGDQKFYMRKLGLVTQSKGNAEEEKFRKYMQTLKDECGKRLLDTLYKQPQGTMDLKFWLMFGKRPFLGMKYKEL